MALLKRFDNVLLASMKSANNTLKANTDKINGVLLPNSPTPTSTKTPTPTPTRTYLCSESGVTIGTQIWTVCNLNVTTYRDGTPIPQVTGTTGVNAWSGLTTGAWCYYNNVTITGNTYGKLYNWYAVAGIYDAASASNPSLRKNLAPDGYHIPTEFELNTLLGFLSIPQPGIPGMYVNAGGKMKLSGTTYWNATNPVVTPYSGFRALPGGTRTDAGVSNSIRTNGYWWTSSEYDLTKGYYLVLDYSVVSASVGYGIPKSYGMSVRLIQDLPATPTPTPTITPTLTPTRTLTPTPTRYPVLPTCAVLYNNDANNVYYYTVSANTSTLLTIPGFPTSLDIAHTLNKLWGVSGSSFVEYNITLPSFTATFNRYISFPFGYTSSPGLAAISDTIILSVNGSTNEVVEIDVSGVSAVMTTKFPLVVGRSITGDFYKTTTNKFLALNNDTGSCYLTQWDYLTGVLEVDIPLTMCGNYGLFQESGNIYITAKLGSVTNLWTVNQNSPYTVSYVQQFGNVVNGASQVPTCLTANLNAPSPYLCTLSDITIGTQTWAACNLNVATYRDGTAIPQVANNTAWAGLTTGAWCYYSGSTTTGNTYGMLYNWYAVNDVDHGGLAPIGYHIPTDAEWTTLTTYLGGETVAGGKMKVTGTTYWKPTNTGASNSSGFTALPGGYRNSSGVFSTINSSGFWWSSTNYTSNSSYYRQLVRGSAIVDRSTAPNIYGFSVRLISDSSTPTPTPTQTPTPTITPTHTPTPTITPTVTPTRVPIVLDAEYLVFTYTYAATSGKDLDTLTTLYVNNSTSTYTNSTNPVGYCKNGYLASGKWVGPNLWWGGDNTNTGGYESVYVDVKQLRLSGVTSIQLNCRMNWFSNVPNTGTGIVTMAMKVWSGGTMSSNGSFGFNNTGGVVKADYPFSATTITQTNTTCSGTDCVGVFTYIISAGTFSQSSICIS